MYDFRKFYISVAVVVIAIILICIGLIASELGKMNIDNRSKAEEIFTSYDFNRDGLIDIKDFAVFRRNYNVLNDCGNVADFNLDCKVNISDYAMFRVYYGQSY